MMGLCSPVARFFFSRNNSKNMAVVKGGASSSKTKASLPADASANGSVVPAKGAAKTEKRSSAPSSSASTDPANGTSSAPQHQSSSASHPPEQSFMSRMHSAARIFRTQCHIFAEQTGVYYRDRVRPALHDAFSKTDVFCRERVAPVARAIGSRIVDRLGPAAARVVNGFGPFCHECVEKTKTEFEKLRKFLQTKQGRRVGKWFGAGVVLGLVLVLCLFEQQLRSLGLRLPGAPIDPPVVVKKAKRAKEEEPPGWFDSWFASEEELKKKEEERRRREAAEDAEDDEDDSEIRIHRNKKPSSEEPEIPDNEIFCSAIEIAKMTGDQLQEQGMQIIQDENFRELEDNLQLPVNSVIKFECQKGMKDLQLRSFSMMSCRRRPGWTPPPKDAAENFPGEDDDDETVDDDEMDEEMRAAKETRKEARKNADRQKKLDPANFGGQWSRFEELSCMDKHVCLMDDIRDGKLTSYLGGFKYKSLKQQEEEDGVEPEESEATEEDETHGRLDGVDFVTHGTIVMPLCQAPDSVRADTMVFSDEKDETTLEKLKCIRGQWKMRDALAGCRRIDSCEDHKPLRVAKYAQSAFFIAPVVDLDVADGGQRTASAREWSNIERKRKERAAAANLKLGAERKMTCVPGFSVVGFEVQESYAEWWRYALGWKMVDQQELRFQCKRTTAGFPKWTIVAAPETTAVGEHYETSANFELHCQEDLGPILRRLPESTTLFFTNSEFRAEILQRHNLMAPASSSSDEMTEDKGPQYDSISYGDLLCLGSQPKIGLLRKRFRELSKLYHADKCRLEDEGGRGAGAQNTSSSLTAWLWSLLGMSSGETGAPGSQTEDGEPRTCAERADRRFGLLSAVKERLSETNFAEMKKTSISFQAYRRAEGVVELGSLFSKVEVQENCQTILKTGKGAATG